MRSVPRLVLVLFGIGVGLGAAEVALRITGALHPTNDLRGLHEPRPDRPWLFGLRPGAYGRLAASGDVLYTINVDGFRGRPYQRPKPPGTFRIVVLGDSIAFGYGVPEANSFGALLEKRLGEWLPDRRVEVVNLGVNGYNPYTEAALFADVGVTYEPDLVLVQFCVNDLNDPTLHFDAQTRLRLSEIPDAAFPNPAERAAPAHPPSMALVLCRRLRICALVDDLLVAWTAPAYDDGARRAAVLPHDSALSGPEWTWIKDRYAEIAATAARAHARFAVLAFPYAAQIGSADAGTVERHLVDIGREGGWATVDLLPAFRRAAARSSTALFLDWWHPTVTGHQIAAEAIVADLQCRGLLPIPPVAPCAGESAASAR